MANGRPTDERASAATVETLFRLLLPVALACFIGAAITDIVYARTTSLQYANMSAWLILIGLIVAAPAIVLFLLSNLGGWLEGGRRILALLLIGAGTMTEIVNMLIHNRDGWTAVVPAGLILSIVGALVWIAAAWVARTPVVVAEG